VGKENIVEVKKKYQNLLQAHDVLQHECTYCVDQIIRLKKKPMVDRDKLIFVQIDQIMQALATRLDKCHEELQQYYLQYVNPSVEYSSSSSTSNDDLNGNFMAISTSVPNQPITDKEKLVSSFQMPQISWNMETIMDDESLTPKTNTERKTKEKEKENKKFKKKIKIRIKI